MGNDDWGLKEVVQHLATLADPEDARLVLDRRLGEEARDSSAPLRALLASHEVIPRRGVLKLQLGEPPRVGLEVGEEHLAHSVDVVVPDLAGNVPVVGQEELEVEVELEHGVLRDVVVGHGLAEHADLVEEEVTDLGDRFDLQLLHNVPHVAARTRF